MAKNPRLIKNIKTFLLTGIVGWIVSLYTLWHRAKVKTGVDLGQAFCNINSKINCDSIALSPYSSIGPVSISLLGMIFFYIVIFLAIRCLRMVNKGYVGDLTQKLLTISSIVGIVSSIALAILSLKVIGTFCLVCGMVYLLCLSLFFINRKIQKETSSLVKKEKITLGLIVILFLAIGVQYFFQPLSETAARNALSMSSGEDLPPDFLKQVMSEFESGNAYEISAQNSPIEGNTKAQVTIVEFSDFECPHCAENHKNLPSFATLFGDQVRIIYKNFPLDTACNSGGMHHKACLAAYAARCVFQKKGFEAFKEIQSYLFKNQEFFDKESILEKALTLGLASSEFEACIDSNSVKNEIKEEIELGKSIGVESTPSVFINGRFLKMGTNPDVLKNVIKKILKK
jgi:protein-disulfide isomerase/uncharacterized membrane protein